MAKRINLDLENPRYTPFSLMEYSSAMAEDTGIRIVETRSSHTASVNPRTKTITIPAVDYSEPMTRDRYRITKGYIDHEIAHLLYPDLSYLCAGKDTMAAAIANLIDDIRIENRHAKNYIGVGEDFRNLNQSFYDRERFFNRDQLQERSFPAIMGTIALTYYGINHKEPFNPDVSDFLADKVFPVIDQHLTGNSPNALRTAGEITALIQDFLEQDGGPSSLPGNTANPDVSQAGAAPLPHGNPENGAEGESCPETPGEPEPPAEEEKPHPFNEEQKSGPAKGEENGAEDCKGQTGCDKSSLMERQLEDGIKFDPPICHSINEYRDTITDLSDSRCIISGIHTGLYEHILKEQAPVISAYRDMFGSFLISTARCRMIKTFEGRFNHRDVARAVTSPAPRLFTRATEGRRFGYDVSLLMDCSGSMGNFHLKKGGGSKMDTAYETLVILAEALRGLPDINLEILAFTADIRYTPGMSRAAEDPCNNQLFILKPFTDRSTGALPYFPLYHQLYQLSKNNFDIGAIKLASRRLRRMPSRNRKLLIVLSDGQPSSEISTGTEILKTYVEELAHIHPVMGIGLENPGIGQCYPDSVNIDNLAELGGQVFTGIRRFLVSQTERSFL
jgi:hypothetical protein